MENYRPINIFLFISFLFFIFPAAVFAYDDKTTHPALTEKIVDIYNLKFGNLISSENKEQIIKGSIDEDIPPRWFNHFYDPIYNLGYKGYRTSKEWAQYDVQEYSWDKAIEYYASEEKEKSYFVLGHILHLIEDATVPDHTRNDTHAGNDLPFGFSGNSPYEDWAKKFNRGNLDVSLDVINDQLVIFSNLNQYFDYLANYSNNNFFSEGTIFYERYETPTEVKRENGYGYGIEYLNNNLFKLLKTDVKKDFTNNSNKNLTTANDLVLSDYWKFLSKQAILSGVGVINIFQQEAEVAYQKKTQEQSNKTALQRNLNNVGDNLSVAGEFLFSQLSNAENITTSTVVGVYYLGIKPAQLFVSSALDKIKLSFFSGSAQPAGPGFALIDDAKKLNTEENSNIIVLQPQEEQKQEQEQGQENIITEENIPEISEAVSTPTKVPPVATQNVSSLPYPGFGGGGAPLPTESTTVVDLTATPTPEPEPLPPPPADTTPPAVSLSISECSSSISSETCFFISTTTLNIFWSSDADDLDYFEFTHSINSGQAQASTTTATSTTISASNNSTNIFSVRAKDTNGNWSDPQTTTVVISSMPVVINEVAWAGSQTSSTGEWIELYNPTDYEINLNNWVLYSQTDMNPYIRLTASIHAKGYYLIERNDDNAVNDTAADLVSSFSSGLNNSGEILVLSQASTTIDRTVLCGAGPVWWCPGFDYKYRTMERKDPDLSGADSANWGYNNALVKNGKDGAGQEIYGTPKARNSINYLIANGASSISSDITLTKSKSPYVVNSIMQVFQNNATLTIEPGAVIKFYNDAGINFIGNSKIIARGTASEPIVFTSFNDDAYGGDLDATSTTPSAGSWFGVNIDTTNNDSVFDNTIFRYGGKYYNGQSQSRANLGVNNNSLTITNSIFEHSLVYGLKLANSNSVVSNNIFRNNNYFGDTAGINSAIYILGGSPQIRNNTISQNGRGIYSSGTAVIDSNIINSNTNEAIYSSGILGTIINNSGSGNGTDGIIFTLANSSATLRPNPFPYVLSSVISVASSTTLTIESGTVFRAGGGYWGGRLDVYGNLLVKGAAVGDIIFTSNMASPNKGDWNGIKMYQGSYSEIAGAIFSYADKAITYDDSKINLSNVKFSENNLAVSADAGSIALTVNAAAVEFLNNTSTTTPANLW